MKFYSLFLFFTLGGLFVLTTVPAFSDELAAKSQRQVRVTTGIGTVQGWEQGLVGKNPNLARWHWDPIYYYKQGYGPVRQSLLKTDGKPTKKQSSEFVRADQMNMAYPSARQHDLKPIHAPYSPQVMAELQGRLLPPKNPQESVLGKLMNRPADEPQIATYGNIVPYDKSSLNTALRYGNQNTRVYGQLLNRGSGGKNTRLRKVKAGAKPN